MEKINDQLFEICYIPNSHWEYLKNLAAPEDWTYKNDRHDFDYPVLVNYILYTFKKLAILYNESKSDEWLLINDNFIIFDTGLLTKNYENIYMILEKTNSNSRTTKPYKSKGFFKESDNQICIYEKLPKRAKFINHIEDLIFDTNAKIVANFEHILEDEENRQRIPESVRNSPNLISNLNGEINRVKKRIECNYKIAVPQCYKDKIQFLLPLSLSNDPTKTDLVLVVNKISNVCYKGFTCLTLDMAYNNARQIAKPETEWLSR